MKRFQVTQRYREELQQNCINLGNPPDEIINDIYQKYQEVRSFDPSFGDTRWSLNTLERILEERKKLIQLLKSSNYIGSFEGISNAVLSRWLERLDMAVSQGFRQQEGWDSISLGKFDREHYELYETLLGLGFFDEPQTATLTMTAIRQLLDRYQNVVASGGVLAQDWTLDDLEEKEKQIEEQIQPPPIVNVDFQDYKKASIEERVNANMGNFTAGVLLVLSFPLEKKSFAFADQIVKIVSHISTTTIMHLFHNHKLRFYLKMDLGVEVIDIETGEITPSVFQFPKGNPWSLRLESDIKRFETGLGGLMEQIIKNPLDTTKKRLHSVQKITLKVANRQFGGCRNYKSTFGTKRCCINPGGKDDLCFWRCLAMGLYPDTPNITKKNPVVQQQKAIELRDHYYQQCGKVSTNIVLLDQIPDICEKLKINIQINTLRKRDNQDVREILLEIDVNPNSGMVYLHYDEQQKHFLKIQTFRSYAEILECSFCRQVFDVKNSGRLVAHELNHQRVEAGTEINRVFKKEIISHSQSLVERYLKPEKYEKGFLCFDFESMLVKQQEQCANRVFTHFHKPIAFVLKGWSAPDFNYNFPPVCYCGEEGGQQLIYVLEQKMEDIKNALKEYLFRKYRDSWSALEQKLCKCPNRQEHYDKCEFKKTRNLVVDEYVHIPILGYNSGKYDLTFLVEHMKNPLMPIKQIISKCSSYMKFGYGYYMFLDAHNYVPPNINLDRFGKMWGVKDIEKGIFPYEWFDSIDKLQLTTLPPIEAFHNKLRNEACDPKDYANVLKVWDTNRFRTFQEYMMYYCERDVDVLIHGLVNFRNILQNQAHLEALDFVSISSIAYNNALKNFIRPNPNIKLQTIENEQIYQIFEMSMFGGACQVFDHYAKLDENTKFIMSLDENNLYGWALTKPLPHGDFELIEDKERCTEVVQRFKTVSRVLTGKPYEERYSTAFLHGNSIPDDPYNFTGYLRCSIFFTEEQKQRLKDFPPLPSKINPSDFFNHSKYMEDIRTKLNIKDSPSAKLVYGVFPLPDYSIFSEMLKYLLENDMCTLEKVYSMVSTPIGYVFRDFVLKMTEKRQEAADMIKNGQVQEGESLKEFTKIQVNSVNGKTIQADDKFNESCVIKTKKEFLKKVVKRQILDFNVLSSKTKTDDGLVELRLKKKEHKIKSPRLWSVLSKEEQIEMMKSIKQASEGAKEGARELADKLVPIIKDGFTGMGKFAMECKTDIGKALMHGDDGMLTSITKNIVSFLRTTKYAFVVVAAVSTIYILWSLKESLKKNHQRKNN